MEENVVSSVTPSQPNVEAQPVQQVATNPKPVVKPVEVKPTAVKKEVQTPTQTQPVAQVQETQQEVTTPEQAPKMLSQEEVNRIVQSRLLDNKKSLYTKYGVKDDTELDALIGRAKQYPDLEVKYNQAQEQLKEFSNRKLLFTNNVNLAKYDDIITYMKGKGLELNADNVKKVLETHKEWVRPQKQPAVRPARLGNTGSVSTPKVSDREQIRGLFPSLTKK
jgi:hypothetical protein